MYPEFERLKKALLNFVKMSVNYRNYVTDFDDVSSYCILCFQLSNLSRFVFLTN